MQFIVTIPEESDLPLASTAAKLINAGWKLPPAGTVAPPNSFLHSGFQSEKEAREALRIIGLDPQRLDVDEFPDDDFKSQPA